MCKYRKTRYFCTVFELQLLTYCSGAIKSAIGHLEGASGIASVIKSVMILERGIIPPNSDFQSINPKINEEALNIKVNTDLFFGFKVLKAKLCYR